MTTYQNNSTESGMEAKIKRVFVKKRASVIQSDFLNKLINQVLSVEHFTLNYKPKAQTGAKENHFLHP